MEEKKSNGAFRGRAILADNIRVERALRRLSQEDLAELARVSKNQIGLIERAEVAATVDVVAKLAQGLQVEIAQLFQRRR